MAEIQFYHLLSTPLQRALPKLMEKALASDMRCVVLVDSESKAKQIDDAMWEYDASSFLPHATIQDAQPKSQPIYITTRVENPNEANVLVVTDGSKMEELSALDKLLDIFDGHDPASVQAARERWKQYKDAGFKLNYIQQQKGGGWKSMATANVAT